MNLLSDRTHSLRSELRILAGCILFGSAIGLLAGFLLGGQR